MLTFADSAPALLERTFKGPKTGRVLLWTTPLARRANRSDRGAWNEFPLPAYDWAFLALMNQTVPYLAGTANEQLNFEAGENVAAVPRPGARFQNFLVTGPDTEDHRVAHPVGHQRLPRDRRPPDARPVDGHGQGRREPADPARLQRQPAPTESQFAPLETDDLDAIFGKDGYCPGRGRHRAARSIRHAVRVGHEIFPWLMMLILIVVTLENLLANTFYKESARPTPAGAAA